MFREIARILKLGGRLAVSDMAPKREKPTEISNDVMAYTGCIAWAVLSAHLSVDFGVVESSCCSSSESHTDEG